jgi:hypothetical protein
MGCVVAYGETRDPASVTVASTILGATANPSLTHPRPVWQALGVGHLQLDGEQTRATERLGPLAPMAVSSSQ